MIRGSARDRFLLVAVAIVGVIALYGMLVSNLVEPATNSNAVAVSFAGAALSSIILVRVIRAAVIATEDGLEVRGLLRTQRFTWNEITGFTIFDWLGRQALWVELRDGRRRAVLGVVGQSWTTPKPGSYISASRDELVKFRFDVTSSQCGGEQQPDN